MTERSEKADIMALASAIIDSVEQSPKPVEMKIAALKTAAAALEASILMESMRAAIHNALDPRRH